MFLQEHKIAQAEFALRNAKYNQQPAEGMTVAVPNVFDRMLAALRNTRPAQRRQHRPARAAYGTVAR
jgi:hypothetical protein